MRASNTERIGVYVSGLIFSKELNWIFREQPIVDVGIDALIEEAIEGNPTGKFLAAQIKTGLGNFNQSKNHPTLYVTKIHYHYWLNLDLPIILIAHLPDSDETFWELIKEKNLFPTNKQWKIKISKSKKLDKNSISELSLIIKSEHQDNFIKEFISGEITNEQLSKILNCAESINESESSINRMTDIINELAAGTRKVANKINYYVGNGFSDTSPQVKSTIKKYSMLLNLVTKKLDNEIDVFADYFSEGFRAYEKLSMIYFELTQDYKSLQEAYNTMVTLPPAIDEAMDGLKLMRNEASGLPTKYPHLKKARLKFINSVNEILNEFKLAKKMSQDFAKNLDEKLN